MAATVGAYEGAVGGGGSSNPITLSQVLGTYTTGVAATTHTFNVTTGHATTAGNTLVLAIHGPGNTNVTAVTDSKGNTYTRDNHRIFGTSEFMEHWSGLQATALVAGDTITVTLDASVTCAYQLIGFSNVVTASRVDIAINNDTGVTNTATADTGLSAATAQAFEVGVASFATVVGGTPSALSGTSTTAGWTAVGTADFGTSGSFARYGSVAYRLTSATGTQEVTWALNAANIWEALLTTYKAATVGGAVAPANTVAPTITAADNNVGTIVTSTPGTWTGTPTPTLTYQWQRSDAAFSTYTDIAGATLSSYTLASADVGFKIRLHVIGTNTGGTATGTSNVIGPVTQVLLPIPANTVLPTISGSAQVGSALIASPGTWTNAPSSFRYQWYQVDTDGVSNPTLISGATAQQYVIQNPDVGRKIFVRVTATNASGSATADSAATATVVTSPPKNTQPPVIGGTALTGSRLTVTDGIWLNANGFTYTWYRGDINKQNFVTITGQTNNYYDLGPADINHTIKARVTATNAGGNTSADSNVAGPIGTPIVILDEELSDIEKSYIAESPPGLWPMNRNSAFGYHRYVFSETLMDALDQLTLMESERFADTAERFLDYYEEMMGLPSAPQGKTVQERRSLVSSRWRRGTFTRALRNSVIESFIKASAGPAAAFGPAGIPILSGIPLYSGLFGDPKLLYHVTEDVETFHYRVGLDPSLGIDNPLLIRELGRITPAGITFDLATDYFKTGGGKSNGKGGGTKTHVP